MNIFRILVALFLTATSTDAFSPLSNSPLQRSKTTTTSLAASKNHLQDATKVIGSAMLAASLAFASVQPAMAESSKLIGELQGSGLVFKDTLEIERFEDPKVKGVELYISNFQRPLSEKLNKGFFNDPSTAAVACAKTGKVSIADNINKSTSGEEVFKESKSIMFKSLRVQRVYDVDTNTLVYVSFNTRLDKGDDSNKSRFASSLCAVNLNEPADIATADATPPAEK
jgi:catabolite regulation protein CreA